MKRLIMEGHATHLRGCPESGPEAVEWRQEHGIPPAPSDRIDVISRTEELPEDLYRQAREAGLLNAGADLVIGRLNSCSTKAEASEIRALLDGQISPYVSGWITQAAQERRQREERERARRDREEREHRELKERQERRERREAERQRCRDLILRSICEAPEAPESLTGRYRRRLLPQSEAAQLIGDAVFAHLASFDRYERLIAADLEHEERCHYADLSYDVVAATGIDAEAYERLTGIEQSLAEGRQVAGFAFEYLVEVREHSVECRTCEAETKRLAARVVATVGEVSIATREYALDERGDRWPIG